MPPLDSSINALVHVARIGVQNLRSLALDLETAEPRFIDGILKKVLKEADSLSSILARLSGYLEDLPDAEKNAAPTAPDDDGALLELAQLMQAAAENGFCNCGNVRRVAVESSAPNPAPNVTNDHARNRALARADIQTGDN